MLRALLPVFLFMILLPIDGAAAGGPNALAPGVDWLQQVTDQVNQLVTTHGDQLVDFGNTELAFLALLTLVGIVVRWQLSHMVIGFRPVNYTLGDLLAFFINLAVCSVLLHYYNTPLPGTSLSIHQVFPALAKAITNVFDQTAIDGFLDRVRQAAAGTQGPTTLDITGAIIYAMVLVNVALMDLIMFAVNAFGFIAQGIFTLFGPLMIPLFITRNFKGKFWHWVDGLLVFSMFRAVAAAVSFIYLNVMIGFFDNTVRGDYTLGHWLALIPTLILLNGGLLWAMFQVPRITGMIFGGVAGQAQAFVSSLTSAIVTLATAA
jgi:type IV secretion system protein VirB6